MKPDRKHIPPNVHVLNGNPSKLAAGRLLDPVMPETALSEPPAHLDAVALEEWHRVGAENKLRELGEAGLIDRTPNGFKQMSAWLQVSNLRSQPGRQAT